jgi:hypothetical protein
LKTRIHHLNDGLLQLLHGFRHGLLELHDLGLMPLERLPHGHVKPVVHCRYVIIIVVVIININTGE